MDPGGGDVQSQDPMDVLSLPFLWCKQVLTAQFGVLLYHLGLHAAHVLEDGHCLFTSVSVVLFGKHSFKAMQMCRKSACRWLLKNCDDGVVKQTTSHPTRSALLNRLQCTDATASSEHWGDSDIILLYSMMTLTGFVVLKMRTGEVHELVEVPGCIVRKVLRYDSAIPHYCPAVAYDHPAGTPPAQCIYFFDPTEEMGFQSNHYVNPVFFDEVPFLFRSAEQLFMFKKAMVFRAEHTSSLIKAANTAQGAKVLSRSISGFDDLHWAKMRYHVMLDVIRMKFSRPRMAGMLCKTAPSLLAEASPQDLMWGIGLSVAEAQEGAMWTGHNMLGRCLM